MKHEHLVLEKPQLLDQGLGVGILRCLAQCWVVMKVKWGALGAQRGVPNSSAV